MKKTILALAFLPLMAVAQDKAAAPKATGAATEVTESKDGLKLDPGSWTEILAKAKKENKYIIMDCMTTWCGPCKHMDKNIFPLKETGDFFNDKFIAVKVQFDSTANDDERVKSWRKDMKEIEKTYTINAYPTYLIFDPNGQVVHRTVGATPDAKTFIAKGQDGLNPETQYYTQLRKYESGEKNPEFMRKMATMAQSAYDLKTANKIAGEYIATITDVYTKDNLTFIDKFTSKSSDKGFALMLENPEKVNAVLGAGKAEAKVLGIVMQEEMFPDMTKALRAKTTPDWTAIATKLEKFPKQAGEALSKGKVMFYQSSKDWNNFQVAVVAYMDKYGSKATPADLNNYAWTVFENCKDMTCVNQALEWSKRSFAEKENPMYMDTYANILHKIGRTKEAIEMQEKVVALAPDAESKKTYTASLEKMKKGEKTWTEE